MNFLHQTSFYDLIFCEGQKLWIYLILFITYIQDYCIHNTADIQLADVGNSRESRQQSPLLTLRLGTERLVSNENIYLSLYLIGVYCHVQ